MKRAIKMYALGGCGRLALAIVLVSLASSCCLFGSGVEVYVPVKENASAQYFYAVQHRSQRKLDLISTDEQSRYMQTREIVRQVIEKVPEYFPEDRKSTPLARLDLVEMDAGLDNPRRVKVSKREMRQAVESFDALMRDYPEYDFIQAKCLYDIGQCQMTLGNYEKAQNAFYEVREGFKGNPDETIRSIAARANYYYNQTFVQGEKKLEPDVDRKIITSPIP